MTERRFLKERVKNRIFKIGLAGAAVLLVVADTATHILSGLTDSRGSVSRAMRYIDKHQPRSLQEYFEILKEEAGINLSETIYRLKQKRLIAGSDDGYALTPLGKQLAEKLKNRIENRLNWDEKWRLVSFDIPEKQRKERGWLRGILKTHEYRQLHKSVFLGKLPLPEEIYREIYNRKLAAFIHIITVGEIDDESKLF